MNHQNTVYEHHINAHAGHTAQELADELGIPVSKVIRIRSRLATRSLLYSSLRRSRSGRREDGRIYHAVTDPR